MTIPHVGLERTIVSAFASLAVAFTVIRFGIARHERSSAGSVG